MQGPLLYLVLALCPDGSVSRPFSVGGANVFVFSVEPLVGDGVIRHEDHPAVTKDRSGRNAKGGAIVPRKKKRHAILDCTRVKNNWGRSRGTRRSIEYVLYSRKKQLGKKPSHTATYRFGQAQDRWMRVCTGPTKANRTGAGRCAFVPSVVLAPIYSPFGAHVGRINPGHADTVGTSSC